MYFLYVILTLADEPFDEQKVVEVVNLLFLTLQVYLVC